ncbi:MAG: glycerol-3-phosphate dehydrogenase/oxidase [Dehalococcoidia bacterium]|nr:glycerol-3-phosphate dehydrogenase/oxidase [Dehalococcoidia bacterium]
MKRDFEAISGKTFDVIVIGGGIVGAGVARDTTLRGLDTLLLEKDDFGSGTTSRSTRLIHGGLRYLRQLEFGLVRQDLSEREVMMRIAPHLVYPLSFFIPIPNFSLNFAMFFGTILYDVISFDKTLPNHKYLSRATTLAEEPGLRVEGLQGSYVYSDCAIPLTERLNWETALSAAEGGASVVNHARVTNVLREGNRITGVEVKDEISGEILQAKGKMVVNAAGQWVDIIKEMLFKNKPPYLRRTKGAHIIIPEVSRHALVLFSPRDGRLFFVIPWEGFSLVGTTDTDYKDNLDAVYATREDVDYILEGLHLAYPDVTIDDVHYAYAGLRSLALKPGKSASDTSRSHALIDHSKRDGLEGLVTILGGKITAYREVAKDGADLACRKLGNKARCITDERPLPGAPAMTSADITDMSQKSGLSNETTTHLSRIYGSRSGEVLAMGGDDRSGLRPISPGGPDILAQVRYAVQNEICMTVSDFMLRRSAVGLRKDLGTDAVATVAAEMQRLLGWSDKEKERQVQEHNSAASLARRFRNP